MQCTSYVEKNLSGKFARAIEIIPAVLHFSLIYIVCLTMPRLSFGSNRESGRIAFSDATRAQNAKLLNAFHVF